MKTFQHRVPLATGLISRFDHSLRGKERVATEESGSKNNWALQRCVPAGLDQKGREAIKILAKIPQGHGIKDLALLIQLRLKRLAFAQTIKDFKRVAVQAISVLI